MVTGDHPTTATSIAQMVGIISKDRNLDDVKTVATMTRAQPKPGQKKFKYNANDPFIDEAVAVKGSEILDLTDDDWDSILIHKEIVFARTTPEQKLRIVKELQRRKHAVAVTGDGVNDAPALRQADVGVAMGAGSSVACEAASLVLLNNNFASVVAAISMGRLAFENLRKVLLYLLPCGSWAETMAVIGYVFFGLPAPLSSFLLIYIATVTDLFSSLSLITEKAETNIMCQPPRTKTGERLISVRTIIHSYLYVGSFSAFWAYLMYFVFYYWEAGITPKQLFFAYDKWNNGEIVSDLNLATKLQTQGQAVFFVTIAIVQMGNLFCVRTRYLSLLQHLPVLKKSRNLWMFLAALASLTAALLIINVPFLNIAFVTEIIPFQFWLIPIAFGLTMLLLDESRKFLLRWFMSVLKIRADRKRKRDAAKSFAVAEPDAAAKESAAAL